MLQIVLLAVCIAAGAAAPSFPVYYHQAIASPYVLPHPAVVLTRHVYDLNTVPQVSAPPLEAPPAEAVVPAVKIAQVAEEPAAAAAAADPVEQVVAPMTYPLEDVVVVSAADPVEQVEEEEVSTDAPAEYEEESDKLVKTALAADPADPADPAMVYDLKTVPQVAAPPVSPYYTYYPYYPQIAPLRYAPAPAAFSYVAPPHPFTYQYQYLLPSVQANH